MSLLLDALQRASKDKEKAASQELFLADPHTGALSVQAPELELEPAAGQDKPVEPAVQIAAEPKVPPQPKTWDLPNELTLDLPSAPPPPQPAPPAQQAATPPTPVERPQPVPMAVAQPQRPQPLAAPAPSEPVAPPRANVSPPGAGRVAQDMRRAYMPASAPSAKRTLVYAGLSAAVVTVLGGVGYQMWDDTAAMRGASSLVVPNPAPPMPPSVAGVPAVAPDASVAASTPSTPAVAASVGAGQPSANLAGPVPADIEPLSAAKPKAVKQVSVPAADTPRPPAKAVSAAAPAPTAATGPVVALAATPLPTSATATSTPPAAAPASNQVQVQGAGAKQSFESRVRGPSPLELGYAALVAGRWDDATLYYNQALKANSEERDALLGLAYVAQQKGQRDDAQVLYRRVLRQEPSNAIASAALLALESAADSALTASRAKELAMRQPDSAATMSMAGTAAVREGLLADAAQLFARAQFLEPANPMHAYNHAVALDRLGQHAAAAVQYEQVLKLSEKPTVGRNAFSADAVRERLAQLRQALASTNKPTK